MKDKFEANLWIAVPAAMATLGALVWLGGGAAAAEDAGGAGSLPSLWLVLPYLAVLAFALAGLNVLVVLSAGIVLSGATGLALVDGYALGTLTQDVYAGFESMLGIMLLAMFVGGLGALMKAQGGLAWLAAAIQQLTQRLRAGRQRTGEAGIAALAALSDVFTANNTVAILLSGSVARKLAAERGIAPKRSASLLDVFACVMQGLLPYGAQALLAGSLAGLSPLAVVGHVYYCWALAAAAVLSIAAGWPRWPAGRETAERPPPAPAP